MSSTSIAAFPSSSTAEHLAVARVTSRVLPGQRIRRPVGTLPLRDRRQAVAASHEPRSPLELVAVDIARAVGIDRPCSDPDDELGLQIVLAQRVLEVDAGGALGPHPVTALKVDE